MLTLHYMQKTLINLFLLITLFSCRPPREEEEPIPINVLDQDKLAMVLADAYLAESASGLNIKNVSGERFDSTYLFNPLKDNNISKQKFDSTMTYYTQHPLKLKAVYDKVLERLSQYPNIINAEKQLSGH